MTTLARTTHGSRLYGLDNPQSDYDEKLVHLPGVRDCLLLRATQNAQSKEGEGAAKRESESFALQRWLTLAANGEDVAICMLHADNRFVLETSPTFEYLRRERARFYTKRMAGMAGFARSMAAKHALRADRLVAVERVIEQLRNAEAIGVARLGQYWDELTEGEYVTKRISEGDRGLDKRILDVAGKALPATITPRYGLDILCKLRDRYGDRVRAARNMDGADLKAISHSFRVAYQLRAIFTQGDFSFPLPESAFIRDVKEGRLNYLDDKLDERLNDLITEVERLAEASTYPERVEQSWLDSIVLEAYYDLTGLDYTDL